MPDLQHICEDPAAGRALGVSSTSAAALRKAAC